jgi:hypothetical protein
MEHASHALQRTALILTLVLGCHVLAAAPAPVAGVGMGARFARWWLYTAKVDVALFAIKGWMRLGSLPGAVRRKERYGPNGPGKLARSCRLSSN